MASFASSASTGGAHKHAWTKIQEVVHTYFSWLEIRFWILKISQIRLKFKFLLWWGGALDEKKTLKLRKEV